MANPDLLKKIKGYFVSGAKPSEDDFDALIDAAADASFINNGELDNAHLPTTIDLTRSADSNIATNSLSTTSATVNGNLNVTGTSTLNNANVQNQLDVAGSISSKEHHIALGVGNEQSATTNTAIRAQLNNELQLDVFSFDPMAGKVSIPVKDGELYKQDEIAGKEWVGDIVTSVVSSSVAEVNSKIEAETSRAKDSELDIVNSTTDQINQLKQADASLQSNIDIEKARIDSILSGVGDDEDSFAELLQKIRALDTSSESSVLALSSRVNVNEQAVTDLKTDIINAEENLAALVSPVQAGLTAEIDRATGEENKLRDDLSIEAQRIDQIEASSANNQVSTLETTTHNSVQSIQSMLASHDIQIGEANTGVAQLKAQSESFDNSLQSAHSDIFNETKRAERKDSELETSINTERDRITDQENRTNTLESALNVGSTIKLGRDDYATPVHVTAHCTVTESLWMGKSIVPSVGHDWESGINFPVDPGGGYGDRAWVHYYAREGENTTLEIGVGNDGEDHITFNATGNIGVNILEPASKFHVNGDALANAWNLSSDVRLKTNISNLSNSLYKISQVRGVAFDWRDQDLKTHQPQHLGVIAQEVESVFPQVVTTNKDGFMSVDYSKLVAPLIEAVKELSERLEEQERQIEDLQSFL